MKPITITAIRATETSLKVPSQNYKIFKVKRSDIQPLSCYKALYEEISVDHSMNSVSKSSCRKEVASAEEM